MNFSQISYFIAIAEDSSVSAAARRLYISQQALSEQLKKLESELNVRLFRRENNLVLTPAGRRFYEGCIKMMTQYNHLVDEVRAMESDRYKKITIGFPGFDMPVFLNEVTRSFLEKNPDCSIDFVKREHHDISLQLSDVDLYFSPLPLADNLENHIILGNDPFVVTFSPDLAKKIYGDRWSETESELIETKSLTPLKKMPFSLLINSRRQILHSTQLIFREHGFEPEKTSFSETKEASDMLCISKMAAVISPLSHAAVRFRNDYNRKGGRLVSYPLKVSDFRTVLAISHPGSRGLHDSEKAFISECMDYFARFDAFSTNLSRSTMNLS